MGRDQAGADCPFIFSDGHKPRGNQARKVFNETTNKIKAVRLRRPRARLRDLGLAQKHPEREGQVTEQREHSSGVQLAEAKPQCCYWLELGDE